MRLVILGFWSVVEVVSIVFGKFSKIMRVLLDWFEILFGRDLLLSFVGVSFCMEGVNLIPI